MSMRTGSQIIIDALVDAGVRTVFGYPGGAIMPFYDALLDSSLEHVLVRHEQGAIHAADGYARASGQLGVCIATSGPGATNLITGISTAAMDSSPVLCITGQVPTALIGTDAFQEADIPGIVMAVSKHFYQVRNIDELPETIAEAIFVATTGRPGPVVLDIPKDVQIAKTDAHCEAVTELDGYDAHPTCDYSKVRFAHELLKASSKPVCMVGGGCKLSGATELFREWCELANVPVITTLNGIGSVDPSYPGWLGMPGMHGHRRSNRTLTDCDLIIALGIRFDDRVTGKLATFATHARIIHVDIDEAELSKLVRIDAALHSDLADALSDWIPLFHSDPVPDFGPWRDACMAIGDGLTAAPPPKDGLVPPTTLLDRLVATIDGDAVVTTDVGQHQMWAAQRVRPNHPTNFITSGGAGTMGFGVPSAMGAAFARPNGKVVAVVGDGGFQMTMAEMATISRCKLPVKILIMDNKYLGMVRQWQEMFFANRYSGVDLCDNPDFAALARVYGITAFTLNQAERIDETLAAWWNAPGPALLHAVCHLEENVFPMVPAGAGLADMVESA